MMNANKYDNITCDGDTNGIFSQGRHDSRMITTQIVIKKVKIKISQKHQHQHAFIH